MGQNWLVDLSSAERQFYTELEKNEPSHSPITRPELSSMLYSAMRLRATVAMM